MVYHKIKVENVGLVKNKYRFSTEGARLNKISYLAMKNIQKERPVSFAPKMHRREEAEGVSQNETLSNLVFPFFLRIIDVWKNKRRSQQA